MQLLVALSVFIPMVANQFDLSAGFNVGISQVLAIGLQGQGLPWWAAVCAVLVMGAAVGLANGLLITRVKIDSFIATLGTGTILYGLNAWYTGGQQVLASLPPEFLAISGSVWIVPAPAIYALAASLTLWIVFEYLPLGRYLYVLGASPRAAELNGISAKRYITLGFVAAGTLAAFAGVVLQSQLQVGQSSVGQEYLLPAFTAALLGATSIRPGRVNVWGTVLAVAGAGGDRRGPEPTRRAFLCRAAVQWLDADPGGWPRGSGGRASPAPRHASGESGRRGRAPPRSSNNPRGYAMSDKQPSSESLSPVLKADWFNSRWGKEDQRGNGNLMTREKVLEAVKLIKTGEIVSLGMPYDARMPLAPGRAYALRMPGGPTGGPYGGKSKTIWNDEFIATEIGQIGTQMDALGHLGCMCGMRGDKTSMLFYNGNRLSDMWSPYGLKKLGIENAPPFFTRGVLFDVQGLKGRVLDVGEEIALADLKSCLERQGVPEQTIVPGDAVFVRTGHGTRWYTETRTFYDGAPGIGLECARWFSSLQVCVVGADNFAVEVVPPVDPEIFHPCHQHLIMENGIHLHEGMTFEGLVERQAWVFAYVFAPLPIVGATGSPGNPIAML